MKIKTPMNKNEWFACGQFLAEWPDSMTFDQVIEDIEKNHNNNETTVTPCQVFEHTPSYELAQNIIDAKDASINMFGILEF